MFSSVTAPINRDYYTTYVNIPADVDECLVSGSCGPNMLCMNSVGSYSCSCRPGYRARKNQQNCLGNCQRDDLYVAR